MAWFNEGGYFCGPAFSTSGITMALRLRCFNWCWLAILTQNWTAPAHAQVVHLSLAKQTITLPTRSFYIERVLDGRTDRAGIGQIQAGKLLSMADHPADLDPDLVQGLTTFLQSQLPARPTDRPALLLVRDLRIVETEQPTNAVTGAGGGTMHRARATLDLYLHAADGYHFVQTSTETVSPVVGLMVLGVAPSHERNISKVLQSCLENFETADWQAAQSRPAQSAAALAQTGHLALGTETTYPILNTPLRPEPGYFPSFLTFRNNQPVAAPALHVSATPRKATGWENLPELIPLLVTAGKEQPLPENWGFSDGSRLYIRYQGHYTELVRQGSYFEFMGPPEGSTWFGTPPPVRYTLDLVAGRATLFADAGRPATLADTARIYVYRTTGAGPATPVFLNNQAVGELAENQVLMLTWTDPAHEPHLRLGTTTLPDLTFLPNFQQSIYVRGVRKPEPGKPLLEIVPTRVGEFDLKAIRLRTRK